MRVRSAVDWWLSLLIWSAIALMTATLLAIPPAADPIGWVIGLQALAFILWVYFGTYYELRDECLYCRSGPFAEKIPYDVISSLRLSQDPLASMALSVNRIEIRRRGKGVITGTTFISPKNRREFLQELVKRCPNLDKAAEPGFPGRWDNV